MMGSFLHSLIGENVKITASNKIIYEGVVDDIITASKSLSFVKLDSDILVNCLVIETIQIIKKVAP